MISTFMSEVEMPIEFEMLSADLDPIAEMQLRTWARRNYCELSERDRTWHPVILDEMSRRDEELSLN